jgi:hypothetical protein
MKTLGFEIVCEDFKSEHKDDPGAIKNARKRIEYGEYWCAHQEWKFLYGTIEDSDDVSIF